ncbi:hypothetical protein M3J09_012885 [Ascochyta lentis]
MALQWKCLKLAGWVPVSRWCRRLMDSDRKPWCVMEMYIVDRRRSADRNVHPIWGVKWKVRYTARIASWL